MADIKLFSISGSVKEMEASIVELERNLQRLIEQNMPLFFGVTFLKSEYIITNGRMDSLGIDENNCPVIFEYKRSVNENVINQGLFYLDWLLDHKADFKFLVMEKLGFEKADAIDWSMPCVICIANDFTKFDEHAVNQMQRNIKLVRYKSYGNELVLFEFLIRRKLDRSCFLRILRRLRKEEAYRRIKHLLYNLKMRRRKRRISTCLSEITSSLLALTTYRKTSSNCMWHSGK